MPLVTWVNFPLFVCLLMLKVKKKKSSNFSNWLEKKKKKVIEWHFKDCDFLNNIQEKLLPIYSRKLLYILLVHVFAFPFISNSIYLNVGAGCFCQLLLKRFIHLFHPGVAVVCQSHCENSHIFPLYWLKLEGFRCQSHSTKCTS